MEYKSHPYYDGSAASDWMYLRWDDWDELEPGPEKTLQDLLRADKPRLCELALNRIRPAISEAALAERPYPGEGDFLFIPTGQGGYQVYIEWYFFQHPTNRSSADSDFWWVIINCPCPVAPFPTDSREDYVVGLGWVVA